VNDSDLYFLLSKLSVMVFRPSALFAIGLFVAFILMIVSQPQKGRLVLSVTLMGYIVFAILPPGIWLLKVLEDRFPVVQDYADPVTGLIVLGGPVSPQMTKAHDQVSLGDGAERLTEFIRLARQHPQAQLVFTGGIGLLSGEGPTEAETAKRFFLEQGLAVDRILFEGAARNTSESAELTFAALQPKPDERWILITSASHMSRAFGLFQSAGWTVLPHPVDFHTQAQISWFNWPPQLGAIDRAAHEWGGLGAAWFRGRIDEPFPGPQPVAQITP